jgi:hypothetical protein
MEAAVPDPGRSDSAGAAGLETRSVPGTGAKSQPVAESVPQPDPDPDADPGAVAALVGLGLLALELVLIHPQ